MCGCCSNSLFEVAIGIGNFDGVLYVCRLHGIFCNSTTPITDPQRTKALDIKLWKHDEACANATRLKQYKCPCQICLGVWLLKCTIIQKHLLGFGQHLRNQGWTKVQYAWCSPLKSSYNPMVHSE